MNINYPIPDGFPYLYDSEWRLKVQQLQSRLSSYINAVPVNGKSKEFRQIGKAQARTISAGITNTNPDLVDIGLRHLFVGFRDSAHILSRTEVQQLGTIGGPQEGVLRSQAAAAGRDQDKTIIDGCLGNAYEGEHGTDVIAWNASGNQEIAVNYIHSGVPANAGLTFDKIVELQRRLGDAQVSGQDTEGNSPITLIVSHNQIADLLHEPKFTSSDFSEIKRLHNGEVISLMGMAVRAVAPQLLPYNSGTDVRTCVAYARESVVFGYAEHPKAFVDVLPGKRHAVQLRTEWGWGCTRIDDEGVIAIHCDESP